MPPLKGHESARYRKWCLTIAVLAPDWQWPFIKHRNELVQFDFCIRLTIDAIGRGGDFLRKAIENGHEAMVKNMLQAGVNVNFRDRYVGTPLTIAYRAGHKSIIKLLKENGATIQGVEK